MAVVGNLDFARKGGSVVGTNHAPMGVPGSVAATARLLEGLYNPASELRLTAA